MAVIKPTVHVEVNTVWQLNNQIIPTENYNVKILSWMGLLMNPHITLRRRIFMYVFDVILLIFCIDVCIRSFRAVRIDYFLKANLIYILSYVLSAFMWLSLRCKRNELMHLIEMLQKFFPTTNNFKMNCCTCLISIMPILYSIMHIIPQNFHDETNNYYFVLDINPNNNILKRVIIFLKSCITFFLFPTMTNLVVILYCSICLTCCKQIKSLTSEIENCSQNDFNTSKQSILLLNEARINDFVHNAQKVFSLPSFLIFMAQFCSSSSMLGWYILDQQETSRIHMVVEMVFFISNAFGCLVACLWVAGRFPIEMDEFKETFRKKVQMNQLMGIADQSGLERGLFEKRDFVFSGCNIIYFRRSSILTVVGTMLTYTLLLLKSS